MMRAATVPIVIPIIALVGKPVLLEGVDVEEEGVGRVAVGDELEVVKDELVVTVYRKGRLVIMRRMS
jgi:hypothetical protein